VRDALGTSTWYFLGNNTLVVAKDVEILMTLRLVPGIDGSSWIASNTVPIGSATFSVTAQVHRGVRANTGAIDTNRGVAELFLTTVSAIGKQATSHIVVPLIFVNTGTGEVGVVNPTSGTFNTAAQGGGGTSGVLGGSNTTSTTTNTTTPVTGNGARNLPGWGIRLWPVPWG
jgi:hypothetical protein